MLFKRNIRTFIGFEIAVAIGMLVERLNMKSVFIFSSIIMLILIIIDRLFLYKKMKGGINKQ